MQHLRIILMLVCVAGCATTSQQGKRAESREEEKAALQSVVGAVSNREVGEEDLRDLSRQIGGDEEARQAVETIAQGLGGEVRVKYCPVTGKRYHPRFKVCPVHGVPLKEVKD